MKSPGELGDDSKALVNLDDDENDHPDVTGLPHFASAANLQGHEDHHFAATTNAPPVSLPPAAFKPPDPRPVTGGLQAYVQQAALQLEESPLHSSKGPSGLDADATAALQAALGGHMDVDPRDKKTKLLRVRLPLAPINAPVANNNPVGQVCNQNLCLGDPNPLMSAWHPPLTQVLHLHPPPHRNTTTLGRNPPGSQVSEIPFLLT